MSTILLVALAAIWFLWIFFVAMMRLKQVRDAGKLTVAIKVFGYPTLAVGLVLDLLVDVVLGSIVFLELPRELTLSARLWRLSNDASAGWRQRLALWARTQLLDSIDPSGVHRG
jgi:hypothetical protein